MQYENDQSKSCHKWAAICFISILFSSEYVAHSNCFIMVTKIESETLKTSVENNL